MTIDELTPSPWQHAKSFYGKAQVKKDGAIATLVSYGRESAQVDMTTRKVLYLDKYTQTTTRHEEAFVDQFTDLGEFHGFPEMKAAVDAQ